MSSFSFATTIAGPKQEYVLRTMNFESIRKIILNLHERERVLHTEEIAYEPNLTEDELMILVRSCHDERVQNLLELFKIAEKLNSKPEVESGNKLGMVFLNHGLGKEAIQQFRSALALDPRNAALLGHLGLALLMDEKLGEAIQAFKQALELKPEYPDLHNHYGMSLLRSENYSEALAEFSRALEIHPKYAEAHFNRALTLVSKAAAENSLPPQEREMLEMHFAKSIEFNPGFQNEYFQVTQNCLAKGQFAEARQALLESRGATVSQNSSAIYHEFYLRLKFGEEGVDRKATEQYISKLEEVLEKHPRYVDIHNDLGVAYLIQCRFLFNRAIQEFKKALAINANYAKAQKNLKLAENEGKGFLILLRAILYS